MSKLAEMNYSGISSWFGSNRTLMEQPAKVMGKVDWLGVVFAGSMPEIPHFDARTMLVNDLHEDVIRLARVIQKHREALAEAIAGALVHPTELEEAQFRLRVARDSSSEGGIFGAVPERDPYNGDDIARARDYFVVSWMSRSATMGTDGELNGGLGLRWNAGGGDTATRFRNAASDLAAWEKCLAPCTFTVMDAFDFIAEAYRATAAANEAAKKKGKERTEQRGLYLDPPFPDAGDGYLHKFTEAMQRRLADRVLDLARLRVRVVMRFHDHPLVRELYPENNVWKWHMLTGRDMHNQTTPEVLIVTGEAV